jgi:hypothetical protein
MNWRKKKEERRKGLHTAKNKKKWLSKDGAVK